MGIPSVDDKIALDATCLIHYSLDLGFIDRKGVRNYQAGLIREFLDLCSKRGVQVGHFEFILTEAYGNIIRAVHDLADRVGVRSYYKRGKLVEKGVANLDRLRARTSEFKAQWTTDEIEEARQFFVDNEVNVQETLGLQQSKPNIPEDNDLRLLVCSHNLSCRTGYILSDDGHFLAYKNQISKSEYDVEILDTKECNQNMIAWKWKD